MSSLPDLRCLEIIDDDNREGPTPDVDTIFPFLASLPVLTEIRFDNLAIHDTDLLRILAKTPELKRLAIVECKKDPRCFTIIERRLKQTSVFLIKLGHVWAENNIEEGNTLNVLGLRSLDVYNHWRER